MKDEDTGALQKMPYILSVQKKYNFMSVCTRYTILFIVCAGVSFFPYLFLRRSFVYRIDGASQYIVYLRYMGSYLREWLGHVLQGDFTPVMYDFTIGMGDDINAIVRFHPLDFLSVFIPEKWTEYLYDVILLIRYYLSGLAFCFFASYWKYPGWREKNRIPYEIVTVNILSGSMVYVFCGYMLMRVMNHPTYASAFIILPLLLLAAEKAMKGRGIILFPLIVFLGFVSNYYFMYICSIAVFLYVLLRLPDYFSYSVGSGISRVRAFFSLFVRLTMLYLLGMCMSFVVFLPTILRYIGSFRTVQTVERKNLLFYTDIRRYGAWLLNIITPFVSSGNGTELNYAVIVYPALIGLFFFCRKKLYTLKAFLIILVVCLLCPAGGYVLAAFNNENNRWMFLFALAVGMTVVFSIDSLVRMNAFKQKIIVIGFAFFAIAAIVVAVFSSYRVFVIAAILELLLCTLILVILSRKHASENTVRIAVLVITCISVTGNAWLTFLPMFGNTVNLSTKAGKAYSRYHRGIGGIVKMIEENDDVFSRVDSSSVKAGSENSGIYYKYNGISMYNSILNKNLLQSLMEEENIGLDSVTHLQDLDGRFPSESLAGTKYYITKNIGERPYGFSDQPVLQTDRYYVYENKMTLAPAYSYDAVILRKDYETLDVVAKELVKLHAAVIEMEDADRVLQMDQIQDTPEKILVEQVHLPGDQEDIQRTQDGYRLNKKKAVLTLEYEKKPGYLNLLYLEGFRSDKSARLINIAAGPSKKSFVLRGSQNTYTLGRENYLINLMAESLDCSEGEKEEIKVTLHGPGSYSIDSVRVFYVPVVDFEKDIEKLAFESLTDSKVINNGISGKLSLKEDRLVTFQVLNQDGWKLFVDGKKTALFCSNVCYLGAVIPKGEHEILLVYETPGLLCGEIVSASAFLLYLILIIIYLKAGVRDKRFWNHDKEFTYG